MAVFEIWKKQFVFVISVIILFLICCETAESGQKCLWVNDTNSSCEICNFILKERKLDCSNRALKSVTLNISDQVIGLDVSNNHLETYPQIQGCPNLEWIDLSNNARWMVLKSDTFRNMKCASLKIINMNNCGILQVAPGPIEHLLPNLRILLIANNSLSAFNMPSLQKLENFTMLDIRGNSIQNYSGVCELMEHNVSVLVDESSNCAVLCAQVDIFCEYYNLTYQLSFCQKNAQGISPQQSLHCVEGTKPTATLWAVTSDINSLDTAGSITLNISSTEVKRGRFESTFIPEEELKTNLIVKIGTSCTGSVALVLLITYQSRKCWKRRRRQNQYNRWLAIYTPPESVCTYRKRVSFSGEIVIKESGENITKKTLNSDEFKKCRQFDISVLIRTQSLPPQLREEEDERPSRVVSWI